MNQQGAAPTPSRGTFWSIERAVAFVLAPLVTAGSAAVTQLITTGAIGANGHPTTGSGIATGTVAIGVAGGFIKWLDGRQFPALIRGEELVKAGLGHLAPFANDIRVIPGASGKIERIVSRGETALDDALSKLNVHGTSGADMDVEKAIEGVREHLEIVIHDAVGAAVEKLHAEVVVPAAAKTDEQSTADTPPPIAPAANDPAPATPLQAVPAATQAAVADSGAASGQ